MSHSSIIAACKFFFTVILASSTIAAQPTQEHTANARLQPVAAATLQGVVRDSSGRPISGASVSLQTTSGPTLTVRTDTAGVYFFPGLRQGIYTIRAEMAGYDQTNLNQIAITQEQSRTIDLTLNSAKAAPDKSSAAEPPLSSTSRTSRWRASPTLPISAATGQIRLCETERRCPSKLRP